MTKVRSGKSSGVSSAGVDRERGDQQPPASSPAAHGVNSGGSRRSAPRIPTSAAAARGVRLLVSRRRRLADRLLGSWCRGRRLAVIGSSGSGASSGGPQSGPSGPGVCGGGSRCSAPRVPMLAAAVSW
ncbi:unnamed protein product [Merluccius merluccius]